MSRPSLKPRDYAREPLLFGRSDDVRWMVPHGGTMIEQALAVSQHSAALAIHQYGDSTAARRIAARFGFSVQAWSDYSLGKSWMTRSGYAAATMILLEMLERAKSR